MLTRSLTVLVAAVALKSIAFAFWQTKLRFGHAVLFMVAGNVHASHPEPHAEFVKPVVQANLLVLLAVMIYAAALMLPRRLEAPDFLVTPLGLLLRANAVW